MQTSDTLDPEPSSPRSDDKYRRLEALGSKFDAMRMWLTKAWRIGILMGKGGYLLNERKRLFQRLGEDLYYRIQKGEWSNAELEPLVREIERITKKVEVEELRIRGIRFGSAEKRRYAKQGGLDPVVVDED